MLEIKELCASYGSARVLDGLNASFDGGRLTCIVGRNGCGKSTLLKCVIGAVSASSGEILVDGTPVSQMSRRDVAGRVAYLSQGKDTPDMTVLQTVLHGRFPHKSYPVRYNAADREIAYSAMEKMGIAHLADRPLSSLSGGMKQNAYVAMALAQGADHLLLDEPTTYLDVSNQLELMNTLRALADVGCCVIAVMHDLPMAFAYADSIAIMDGGKIVLQDTPRAVCASSAVKSVFGVGMTYDADKNRYFYEM